MITGSKTSFFHFLGLLSGILLLSALIAPALADWCPAGGFVQCKITTVLSCPCSRPISLLAPSSERVNLFLHISIQNIKTESRPFIPLFFFVRTIIGLDSNTYETCGGRRTTCPGSKTCNKKTPYRSTQSPCQYYGACNGGATC
ncbi:MAG: hypothetical protein JOS17DRAFT_161514 [Linnemannia elongata]|nr:MAG: hypothetical protein JOS17DRAFT_161514 [Linnemannia elongata]